MHARYKEIQRLNKSNVSGDNKEATARLVNILSIILGGHHCIALHCIAYIHLNDAVFFNLLLLASSQLALLDRHCVASGL